MDLPNSAGRFKPAMLANMTITDRPSRQQLIPSRAIVREANREHVLVQTGESVFLLREVNLGEEFGDRRVLLGGLKEGEKIVLEGAFHLNNERKKAALHGE
jgi:cobalt-zinc-cadmium efflux system membrane fusion protein